ncbi:hypothetical protein [Devosia sp. 919]|uniref:hypothetical protein n=1 Tax=Devosia sp. 919 TaxID=2726065 RepID=UPI00155249E4|nr:hypothetical protein [Devosia sp. 919]
MTAFQSIFVDLERELEEAGYELFPEFYTDMLDEDYQLNVGGNLTDEIELIMERFHERAQQILTDLPAEITNLQASLTD